MVGSGRAANEWDQVVSLCVYIDGTVAILVLNGPWLSGHGGGVTHLHKTGGKMNFQLSIGGPSGGPVQMMCLSTPLPYSGAKWEFD